MKIQKAYEKIALHCSDLFDPVQYGFAGRICRREQVANRIDVYLQTGKKYVDEACAHCNGTRSVRVICMQCHRTGTVQK